LQAEAWDICLSVFSRGYFGYNRFLKKTVQKLNKSDFIIYSPGGSVINKRFWWSKQLEYLVPFFCAKAFNVPIAVAAPSIGPFDCNKNNVIIKWLLKTANPIVVREEISRHYLSEIGIKSNVHVTIDSAFYCEINYTAQEIKLKEDKELNNFLKSYKKTIGVTITDFKWHVSYSKDVQLPQRITEAFYRFILYLSQINYGVLFIPQLFGNQNDYNYMNSFSLNNTFTMSDKMNANFQQFIISKLFSVVGMRYHSNIFSAKMGTPFIAVVYEEKMQGFIDMSGLENCSIPLDSLSGSALIRKFSYLKNNYTVLKDSLLTKRKHWQNKAADTMRLLKKN
jgi:colanic acid/amylovoran biosynthesis protein